MKTTNHTLSAFYRLSLGGFLLLFIICLLDSESQERVSSSFESDVKSACEGVGVVEQICCGTEGNPIVILEENHTSRLGQIQHAIALVRLHERNGLSDIALEGYLLEEPPIQLDWFINASRGLSLTARNRVAVRLLKEGEISCAEFMKLVYSNINLHPVETLKEYGYKLQEQDSRAPLLYLYKIAVQSLQEIHIQKLGQLQREYDQLKSYSGTNKEAMDKKLREIYTYILSVDPWVKERVDRLQNENVIRVMSGEEQLYLLRQIADRANKLSVKLESEEREAMERYINFYDTRMRASKTIARLTERVAEQPKSQLVALDIGAAHSQGISAIFKDHNRSFAVLTPLSFMDTLDNASDIPLSMLIRKYTKQSIFTEGFTKTLLRALPQSGVNMKPRVVLQEDWFQAKAELYLFTDRITREILGHPIPPNKGNPPYGFPKYEFRGKWVSIDPNRCAIIPDKDGKGRAILFPVELNYSNPERQTEIWVKSGLGVAIISTQEQESVETMLQNALEEVKKEKKLDATVEDDAGRIQITLNTVAAFAENQQIVKSVTLGCI